MFLRVLYIIPLWYKYFPELIVFKYHQFILQVKIANLHFRLLTFRDAFNTRTKLMQTKLFIRMLAE
jgi:hypothetical protein